jgi:CheY-like chemotaxis protein
MLAEETCKFPDFESFTTFLRTLIGEGGGDDDRGQCTEGGVVEPGLAEPLEASILLVEEEAAVGGSVREWLAKLLPGCQIGKAASVDEAVAVAQSRPPDVILVNVATPSEDGVETVRRLKESVPAAEIVALTMDDGKARREELESAGASASLAIWRIRRELMPILRNLPGPRRERMEGKTVLCIDDEPDIIDLIELALARDGVNLVGALGGRAGLDAVRQVKPDLVLLDLMMPDVDGWQVYQRIKADERIRDIPVIVITVLDPYWGAKQGLDLTGVDGYVTKPFEPQELVEKVSRALRVVA